jgi:SNF2 family DNA or RNA helicase
MIVVEDKRQVIFRTDNPAQVAACLPTAQQVGGHPLVMVSHDLDSVRVLNNMGIRVPSPILYHYNWPGRFTPYKHQRLTSAFLTIHPRCLVLNDIGTGKTQSALWAADYLMSIGAVKRVLVLSPLSTLDPVWSKEIFTSLIGRVATVLRGTAKRRRKLLASADADYYIVNHEGFEIIADQADGMFDLVIVDEAAVYRNPQTRKFKILYKFLTRNPNVRLWLMTGTPTPNEPTDAWALAKLVGNTGIARSYSAFRDLVMQKVGNFRYVPKAGAIDTVRQILQPAIRFTRDECLDLPAVVTMERKSDMSDEQRAAYNTMVKSLMAEHAGGQITAVNEAVKVNKLLQISCGVAYDTAGRPVEFDATPRVDLVREFVDALHPQDKVIVFVPLTGVLAMLYRELSKHYTCAYVYGDVSAKDRTRIFHEFQNDPDPRILIAHPGCMAHGLTLTRARMMVWYGPIDKNEIYTQACGRTERIGKQHTTIRVHIYGSTLEKRVYNRLEKRQSLQGLLLEVIEAETRGEQQ